MKRFLAGLAITAAAVAVTPAAAVTISSIGAANSYPSLASVEAQYAPGYTLYDFDAPGTNPLLTGGVRKTDDNAPINARPQGDATTGYYAVGPDAGLTTPATLAVNGINQLSLYWGSVDSYNTVTFNFTGMASQSFGGALVDGTDAQRNGREVTFSLSAAEAAALTSVTFGSTTNAFEFDNVIFGQAVPEPATYGIMTLGLGLMGAVLRRRRQLGESVSFSAA